MDFTDITFTITNANIFSGIEPCLAVVLASVPLMGPLLGRSVTTARKAENQPEVACLDMSSREIPLRDEDELEGPDNVNRPRLRPLGVQHRADISALCETIHEDSSEEEDDDEPIHRFARSSTIRIRG